MAQTKVEAGQNTRWGEVYDLRWVHGMSVDDDRDEALEPTVNLPFL